MQRQCIDRHRARLIERAPGRDATRQIGERDPVIALRVLVQERDVVAHGYLVSSILSRAAVAMKAERTSGLVDRRGSPNGSYEILSNSCPPPFILQPPP